MLIANFHKAIKIQGEIIHFQFYGFDTAMSGKRFFISAHNGEDAVFHMRPTEDGNWVMIESEPYWAKRIEDELSNIIIKELRSNVA